MKNTGTHIMSCPIYGGLVYRELLSYYIKKAKPHSSFLILHSSFFILHSSFFILHLSTLFPHSVSSYPCARRLVLGAEVFMPEKWSMRTGPARAE